MRTKSKSTLHLHKKWLYKYYNAYENEIEAEQEQKTQKDERLVFPKEQVGNADLSKAVLNNIMI